MPPEGHALTLTTTEVDGEGEWDVAECSCGWVSPPSPDTEVAAGFWSDHVWAVANA